MDLAPKDPALHAWTLAVGEASNELRVAASMLRAGLADFRRVNAAADKLRKLLRERKETR